MLRGTIKVTCPNCGKAFIAPDIEWNATLYSAPVKCPHCHQMVNPNGHTGLLGTIRGWLQKKILPVFLS